MVSSRFVVFMMALMNGHEHEQERHQEGTAEVWIILLHKYQHMKSAWLQKREKIQRFVSRGFGVEEDGMVRVICRGWDTVFIRVEEESGSSHNNQK